MTMAGGRLIAAAKEMRTMAKIPEDIIKAGRRCYDGLGRGSVSDSEHIAIALLAAEKRGEERERGRIATDLFDRDAFMTACAGDGDPYVKIQFKTLKEMHSFHRTLCDLAAIRKEPAE